MKESETADEEFAVFDAGNRRYALNLRHLTFCHFLFDAPNRAEEADDGEEHEVEVYLTDSPERLVFGVDPDTASLDEEENPSDQSVQLQDMLFYAEQGTDARLRLTDRDGETAFFRAADVAMFSGPTCRRRSPSLLGRC